MKSAVLAAALAFAYAGAAAADEATGFYAGVGLGQSNIEEEDLTGFDEDDTGFKLFGGYQINKYLAAEVAYTDFSDPDADFGPSNLEVEAEQVSASAVGTYAFNDRFGVMARLGVAYVDTKETITLGSGLVVDLEDDATELSYGVGLWVAPTKNLRLRLEYEMTSASTDEIAGNEIDLSLLSLSAVYKFGK